MSHEQKDAPNSGTSPLLVNRAIFQISSGPAGVQVNFDMPPHEIVGLLTQVLAQIVQADLAERRRAGAGIQVVPAGSAPTLKVV